MRTWRRGYDGGSNTNKCFMIILVLLFQNALWTLSSHMLLVSLVRSIYGENKCIIMDSSRWQSRDEVEGAWQKHYRPWIISRRWTANIEMKEQRLQTWSSKKGSEHISYISYMWPRRSMPTRKLHLKKEYYNAIDRGRRKNNLCMMINGMWKNNGGIVHGMNHYFPVIC